MLPVGFSSMAQKPVSMSILSASATATATGSDGTSTGLMDGLACGLVPVVSDIPANREWVPSGSPEGFLVPVGDVEALGAALQTVLAELPRSRKAAEVNREKVVALADGAVNRTRLLQELTEVVSRGRLKEGAP